MEDVVEPEQSVVSSEEGAAGGVDIPFASMAINDLTPTALEFVRTEKTSLWCYGVSWRADQKLLCAVTYGVDIRAADLTLQKKIEIPGDVFSVHSVGDKLITKIQQYNKYCTYIGTEQNPTQALIHEVSHEGNGNISHMSATITRIAVIDIDNSQLRVYTITGDHLYNISLTGMKRPWGVHILPDDTVLVTDYEGGELRKYPLQADAEPVWTLTGLEGPTGVTSDESGNIYVSCHNKGKKKIKVISPQGKVIRDLYPGIRSASLPPGIRFVSLPPGIRSASLPPGIRSASFYDICVRDGMMAVACWNDGVKLYKLIYE